MQRPATPPNSVDSQVLYTWRTFGVERGDASAIAKLTPFGRNYVDKVLRGTRSSEEVEAAALKFFELRKELRGA